jgi:Ca-activated chloride channel family protein
MKLKKNLSGFGESNLLTKLMPDVSKSKPILKFYLVLAALLILVIVIARPQFGSKLDTVKRKGVEIIIALDVSNSMMAQDIQPSRLERAKMGIAQLIGNLQNDKVGMIVFAGEAYIQLPITSDYVSANMFLQNINPNMVPVQGTAIGSAIDLASRSFTQDEKTSKTIIVITDGENHEDDAIEAAKRAAEKGIIVNTIGIGSTNGTPIPVSEKAGDQNFMKDRQGQVIVSKLDETGLSQIANAGNGTYVRAGVSQNAVKLMLDKIQALNKTEMESQVFTAYDEKFQYLAALAFIILIIELFLLEKRNKLIRKIKLFDTK